MKWRFLTGNGMIRKRFTNWFVWSTRPGRQVRDCREMQETKHVYHQCGTLQRGLEARSIRKCFLWKLPHLWIHGHVLNDSSGVAYGQQRQQLGKCSGLREEENENKLGYAMHLYVYPSMCLSFYHFLKVMVFVSVSSIPKRSLSSGQL